MRNIQVEIINELSDKGYIQNWKIKKTTNLMIQISKINTNKLVIEKCDFSEVENVFFHIINSDNLILNINECKFNNINFEHSKLNKINLSRSKVSRLLLNELILNKISLFNINSFNILIKNNEINSLYLLDVNSKILSCSYNKKILDLEIIDCNIINKITIDNNKIIENLLIDSLYLEDSKSTDISIWNNFITKDFQIFNLKIKSFRLSENRISSNLIINKFNVKILSFFNNIFEKNIIGNMKFIKISKADSETYRVLKHFANKNSDNTNYLIFNKLEQNELIKEGKLSSADYIILYFKKFISDFGTDWGRAFVVTFFLTLIIFYLPIFYFLKSNFVFCSIMTGEFWNGYLKFLNITDYSNPLKLDKTPITNGFINTWLFFGKIIMAVCIYEIIISFRKYHK